MVNSVSKTVAHLEEHSNKVSGFWYNEGRNQKWEVLSTGRGTWFIRNHYNGQYLGIDRTTAENHHTTLVGTGKPFAWDIAQKYFEGRRIPQANILYVPNTELAIGLDDSASTKTGTGLRL